MSGRKSKVATDVRGLLFCCPACNFFDALVSQPPSVSLLHRHSLIRRLSVKNGVTRSGISFYVIFPRTRSLRLSSLTGRLRPYVVLSHALTRTLLPCLSPSLSCRTWTYPLDHFRVLAHVAILRLSGVDTCLRT